MMYCNFKSSSFIANKASSSPLSKWRPFHYEDLSPESKMDGDENLPNDPQPQLSGYVSKKVESNRLKFGVDSILDVTCGEKSETEEKLEKPLEDIDFKIEAPISHSAEKKTIMDINPLADSVFKLAFPYQGNHQFPSYLPTLSVPSDAQQRGSYRLDVRLAQYLTQRQVHYTLESSRTFRKDSENDHHSLHVNAMLKHITSNSTQPSFSSGADGYLFYNYFETTKKSPCNVSDKNVCSSANLKKKRSWSRAVFSNLQRKGLEKRFEIQKYVTKPDRKQLAAMLGLTDAQVKVWFQNRRMKWRHLEEAANNKMQGEDGRQVSHNSKKKETQNDISSERIEKVICDSFNYHRH